MSAWLYVHIYAQVFSHNRTDPSFPFIRVCYTSPKSRYDLLQLLPYNQSCDVNTYEIEPVWTAHAQHTIEANQRSNLLINFHEIIGESKTESRKTAKTYCVEIIQSKSLPKTWPGDCVDDGMWRELCLITKAYRPAPIQFRLINAKLSFIIKIIFQQTNEMKRFFYCLVLDFFDIFSVFFRYKTLIEFITWLVFCGVFSHPDMFPLIAVTRRLDWTVGTSGEVDSTVPQW